MVPHLPAWRAALATFVLPVLLTACLDSAAQAVSLDVPPGIYIAPAPASCTADTISNTSWGVATSAYQIEGGHNEGGRAPSIWDTFVNTPSKIKGGATGDVAIDHYHLYKEDYQLMKGLGVNIHRFSISWPRIIPEGLSGSPVNIEGLQFYHNLIDEMLANGITPVATMYHWDLPQALQDVYEGFLSPNLAEDFNYYATVLFENFGGKIKHWITFNEPPSICDHGYNNGIHAPGYKGGRSSMFRCGHNLLLAHAAAVKTYREVYLPLQGGKIGITSNVVWPVPMTDSYEDKRAAQNKLDREFGWIFDPLFFGDYPVTSQQALGSDLPAFTEEEKAMLKGSTDFVGVNCYTARYVWAHPDNPIGFKESSSKNGTKIGERGGVDWLLATPFALGGLLSYIGERYSKAETWVTEFGTGITGENLWQGDQIVKDAYRTSFYSQYLNSACDAISRNNLNVPIIFAWTMFDNFEWGEGYDVRYGLVHVDFSTLQRTVKESGYWWSQHFFRHSKQIQSV